MPYRFTIVVTVAFCGNIIIEDEQDESTPPMAHLQILYHVEFGMKPCRV